MYVWNGNFKRMLIAKNPKKAFQLSDHDIIVLLQTKAKIENMQQLLHEGVDLDYSDFISLNPNTKTPVLEDTHIETGQAHNYNKSTDVCLENKLILTEILCPSQRFCLKHFLSSSPTHNRSI